MTPRAALGASIGAAGVVAGVVGFAVVAAAVLVALGLPSQGHAGDVPSPTAPQPRPDTLVVALDLGNPARQAGVVRNGDVILARGLEVDVAREIGRRIGIPRVRFVYVRPSNRVLAANAPWHLALASIRASAQAAARADLSEPYLGADQAVVLRKGLSPLGSIRDLRALRSCAVRGSDGARALTTRVAPSSGSMLSVSLERLFQLVQTGVCDAALVAADDIGRFVAGRGALLGPVTARVAFGNGYVVEVTRGGPISAAEVGRALRRMRADGTMHRLVSTWLAVDPARLRLLR